MRIRGVLACCVLVGCAGEGTSSVTHAVIDGPFAYLDGADVAAGSVRGVTSIDVGDLSGDGNPDVVVLEGGRHAGDRVTFAWFEAPSSEGRDWTRHEFPRPDPFRPFVGAAKVGDVDGDGDQDVVVSMDNHSGSRRSAYIYWLENDGADWRVQSIARDLRAHHINDMELTDLDDDGRLDVIVRALEPNELRLYFQDASGWTERILDASPYGGTGEGFSVGDIDRRGAIDITICGHWLEAPSDPRRENYRAHDVDADFKDTNANVKEAVGDINGDGRNDVVLSPAEGFRGGGNHVLAWYEAPSDPTGRWTQHVVERDFNGGHVVRLLDFDGDGDLDLLSGVAWSRWGQTANITLYPNRDGAFGSAQVLVSGQGLYNVGVGDIGRDGDLDFVGQDTYSGSSRPYLYESEEGTAEPRDAGADDDAGVSRDAGMMTDAGAFDSGAVDSGAVDSGAVDSGAVDSGAVEVDAATSRDASAARDAGTTAASGGSGCATSSRGTGAWACLLAVLLLRRRR